MLNLKEIRIKNFKSLKDCRFELRNFNVLVGANASGKTNLVDLFLLLRKIYVEKEINPFRYWWGYQNAVWDRKEELDISVEFLFDYTDGDRTYRACFETTFTGRGGRFDILMEKLEIKGILSIELEGNVLTVKHSEDFLHSHIEILEHLAKNEFLFLFPPALRRRFKKFNRDELTEKLKKQTVFAEFTNTILDLKKIIYRPVFRRQGIAIISAGSPEREPEYLLIINPTVNKKPASSQRKISVPLFAALLEDLHELFSRMLVLKLNIDEIKRPSPLKKEEWLSVDGSNLNSVLYSIYLKENKIPDRIAAVMTILFPNFNIGFSVTEDQRVYLRINEDDLELPPVCIADGLYKLLAILSALKLEPSLLIIDEVENSLHPRTLEILLDELKSSDAKVIVTTHSPVIVDMTEPEDLVIVEKIAGETKFRRIKNPEEIKRKLREAGITFSEGWLYGEI